MRGERSATICVKHDQKKKSKGELLQVHHRWCTKKTCEGVAGVASWTFVGYDMPLWQKVRTICSGRVSKRTRSAKMRLYTKTEEDAGQLRHAGEPSIITLLISDRSPSTDENLTAFWPALATKSVSTSLSMSAFFSLASLRRLSFSARRRASDACSTATHRRAWIDFQRKRVYNTERTSCGRGFRRYLLKSLR